MKAFLKGIIVLIAVTGVAAGVLSLASQSSMNTYTEKSNVRL